MFTIAKNRTEQTGVERSKKHGITWNLYDDNETVNSHLMQNKRRL